MNEAISPAIEPFVGLLAFIVEAMLSATDRAGVVATFTRVRVPTPGL